MALKIVDGIIHIRRGDSGYLTVTIKDDEDQEYEMQDGDILTLTVRERAEEESPVLASITSYDGEFYFTPSDTSDIMDGKYSFDVQLTRNNGDIETVIPHVGDKKYERGKNWGNFCVEAEVTVGAKS